MVIKKELLDELIELAESYYSHNLWIDELIAKEEEVFGEDDYAYLADIIAPIGLLKKWPKDHEIYYKVFEVLGYEIH